jgi:DNA-binding Lrp family transcriptional regulator
MDDLRHRILEALVEDSRSRAEDLAVRLGTTREKVEKAICALEEERVILKYTALVDWTKVRAGHVYAFIEVKASPEHGQGFDSVADHVARFEEVHSLYLMSGAHDLMVVIQGEDFREIAEFVAGKLACLPQVTSTATSFVLRTYKQDGLVVAAEAKDQRLAITP